MIVALCVSVTILSACQDQGEEIFENVELQNTDLLNDQATDEEDEKKIKPGGTSN